VVRLSNIKMYLKLGVLSIIRIIKSRRIRWVGRVARMGERGMHRGFWWESRKERDH
jgi:hypothetical protein